MCGRLRFYSIYFKFNAPRPADNFLTPTITIQLKPQSRAQTLGIMRPSQAFQFSPAWFSILVASIVLAMTSSQYAVSSCT